MGSLWQLHLQGTAVTKEKEGYLIGARGGPM